MKPLRRQWSAGEDRSLCELYPGTPMPELLRLFGGTASAIYQRARTLGVKRSDAYLASAHGCRLRQDDNPGVATRFVKGHTSWNKGVSYTAGGRSAETRFKAGRKPHTWNPVGHERLTKDGYLQRKVTDTGYTPNDYRMVHHLLWETVHSPIPPGHCLIFKDRDKANIVLDNLELITRAENCRRNSIHRYPPELKDIIRLQKKLERTIRKRTDEQTDN